MRIGATKETDLIGLTEKGLCLDFAMRAIFQELFEEAGTAGGEHIFKVAPGTAAAANRHFDALWRTAGLNRSVLKTEILGLLSEEPRSMEDLQGAVRRNLPKATGFEESVDQMRRARILTTDPDRMWVGG